MVVLSVLQQRELRVMYCVVVSSLSSHLDHYIVLLRDFHMVFIGVLKPGFLHYEGRRESPSGIGEAESG